MKQYIELGKKIYKLQDRGKFEHIAAFVIRALFHKKEIDKLVLFLEETPLRYEIMEACPFIYAQATRPFFFRESTFQERSSLIEQHFSFFETRLSAEALRQIYCGDGITLWEEEYQEEKLSLSLDYSVVNKKEGLIAAILKIGETVIYQLVFWVEPDRNGQVTIWVGALQGLAGGSDIIRSLTKYFFGYRPKNIMIRFIRILADQFKINQIKAVSNFGFYDSTLPKHKQKLRTSLDDFWQETGGTLSDDSRFFILPVVEPQKSIDDVVSHKRNLYRKRYAFLAEIEEIIKTKLKCISSF